MSEATRLNADIQKTEAAAQEASQLEEQWRALGEQAYDAASKYDLLRTEIDFNEALVTDLENLLELKNTLDSLENTLFDEETASNAKKLSDVEARISSVKELEATAVVSLLRGRATELRRALVEKLEKRWNELILFDYENRSVRIKGQRGGRSRTP